MEEKQKIKTFKDLTVWQEGHKLVLSIYKVTRNFPRDELFALVSQMRRAVISITSNIAEGFSRHSPKEKVQFYSIAHGSLTELENQLMVARDVGYLAQEDFNETNNQLDSVHRLLNAFIKTTKTFQ